VRWDTREPSAVNYQPSGVVALRFCELVAVATAIDLAREIKVDRPSVRVHYKIEEIGKPVIGAIMEAFALARPPAMAGPVR